jgi:hypothetical protein
VKFRIQRNTDNRDIEQECTGLDAWVPGDSVNRLKSNRGLHIQIRHNRDQETFETSVKLAQLIAAAPELLEAIGSFLKTTTVGDGGFKVTDASAIGELFAAYRKAGGTP